MWKCQHFDKDEDLLDECGVYVHPFISTVTYLSEVGAPTVVIGARVTAEGELNSIDAEDRCGSGDGSHSTERKYDVFASYPVLGKHIAFNGRLLHGCPSHCALPRSCTAEQSGGKLDTKTTTTSGDGRQRVSLLVNIWLNHKPLGVEPISAAASPPVLSPEQHSARAAAAASKLRSSNVWTLGDAAYAAAAAVAPQKVKLRRSTAKAESDSSIESEVGEGGIPVGCAGQRLVLRLPVADFHSGIAHGNNLFQARLPATICLVPGEVESDSEDDVEDASEEDEEKDGGEEDEVDAHDDDDGSDGDNDRR